MGIMDILNGMQNGPRGQRDETSGGAQSGGMSPIMMALLGLLAYKAIQGGGLGSILGGGAPQSAPTPPQRAPTPSADNSTLASDAGLGDLLGGMLGGNASAGRQSGGLGDILGGMLGGNPSARGQSGGLGDILGGMLGGGAAAGNVLNGGLGNLLSDLQNAGQGGAAQSWVGTGTNERIAPEELDRALGADTIDALAAQTGMGRQALLADLSDQLPAFIDQLTPEGRLPTNEEAARW